MRMLWTLSLVIAAQAMAFPVDTLKADFANGTALPLAAVPVGSAWTGECITDAYSSTLSGPVLGHRFGVLVDFITKPGANGAVTPLLMLNKNRDRYLDPAAASAARLALEERQTANYQPFTADKDGVLHARFDFPEMTSFQREETPSGNFHRFWGDVELKQSKQGYVMRVVCDGHWEGCGDFGYDNDPTILNGAAIAYCSLTKKISPDMKKPDPRPIVPDVKPEGLFCERLDSGAYAIRTKDGDVLGNDAAFIALGLGLTEAQCHDHIARAKNGLVCTLGTWGYNPVHLGKRNAGDSNRVSDLGSPFDFEAYGIGDIEGCLKKNPDYCKSIFELGRQECLRAVDGSAAHFACARDSNGRGFYPVDATTLEPAFDQGRDWTLEECITWIHDDFGDATSR